MLRTKRLWAELQEWLPHTVSHGAYWPLPQATSAQAHEHGNVAFLFRNCNYSRKVF